MTRRSRWVPAKHFVASAWSDLSAMPISLRQFFNPASFWMMDTKKYAVMNVSQYFDPPPHSAALCFR
jgi:hypothetical protein